MKKILYSIFLLVAVTSSYSQTRLAFVNGTAIIKKMPETADVESRLNQMVENWNREATDMQTELDRKRTEYERKKLIMTDGERTSIETDIAELQSRLNKFRQEKYGPGGELFSQQAILMKPVYDKLLKAIEEVAVEGKYDYVFDRSSKDRSMLYSNAKYDLSGLVIKKLGLEGNDIFNTPLMDRFNSPNTPPSGTSVPERKQQPVRETPEPPPGMIQRN
jgi:Skp family chaperone for outer membrane proteins